MVTVNNIIKEIKEVPVKQLEELYSYVQSLTKTTNKKKNNVATNNKKILSFGGAFSDFSTKDYAAFVKHTKKSRLEMFDRSVEI